MPEINGYQLGRLLGQGTFGETYEATKGDQRFALKLIREEAVLQGWDGRRFEREVRALQKATGPNVVKFIEAGEAQLGNEARLFVVLEYLEGQDLSKYFRAAKNQLAEETIKDILVQIVAGLRTIHSHNIIHRDLKPANVFVTKDAEVKLLDFGLVKMLDYTTLTTAPGQPIGTPLYIAPEILRGDEVDVRADFYSLGVLMYHLVTGGQHPFEARTPLELYAKVVNNPPLPPTRHNQSISSEFENLILVLLSKQPYERTFNHEELERAIRSTPIIIPRIAPAVVRTKRTEFPKRCFFRLLQNEKTDLESFIQAGGKMDAIEFPANFMPRLQNSLAAYKQWGIEFLFDPVTYRLAYSSFALTQSLTKLPYVPDPNNVLTPRELQTIQALQKYARGCIDWQMKWGCATLVAPFHFCRDLGSPWIDIDIKLIEEAVSYGKSLKDAPPVYAGLCLNIEQYTVAANRLALLNRYSRARADGYLFYVDTIDERTNNPLQLRALLDLLQMFQQLGKPVFACRVGTLGLALLAAGVDGISNGIASLSSFSEANLLVNRSAGYDMTKKYYVPSMMLTLPVPMVEDILSDNRNASLHCNCPHCQGAARNLGKGAKPHFLHARTNEVKQLNALQNKAERIEWLQQRIDSAIQVCNRIRSQQLVDLQPGYYSHLRTWLDVFCKSQP
jgi:serine/threonine-protein kinase